MSKRNPYAVLGVSDTAESFVIEAAYRAGLKRYHPDKYKGEDAATRTSEIVDAYNILRDPVKRSAFDASEANQRRKSTPPPPPSPPPSPPPPASSPEIDSATDQEGSPWRVLGYIGLAILAVTVIGNAFNSSSDADLSSYAADQAADMTASDYDYDPYRDGPDLFSETVAAVMEEQENTDFDLFTSAGNVPPIEFDNIETGVSKFAEIYANGGFEAARRFSANCHSGAAKQGRWGATDYCAAFDMSGDHRTLPDNSYFRFQASNQDRYYEESVPYGRLRDIREAVDSIGQEILRSPSIVASPTPLTILPQGRPTTPLPAPSASPTGYFYIDENGELKRSSSRRTPSSPTPVQSPENTENN